MSKASLFNQIKSSIKSPSDTPPSHESESGKRRNSKIKKILQNNLAPDQIDDGTSREVSQEEYLDNPLMVLSDSKKPQKDTPNLLDYRRLDMQVGMTRKMS